MIHKCWGRTGNEERQRMWWRIDKEKMVYDKVVYERCCVTKKDGVCDKVVCERWCVWKLCVKESVWNVVCERWCVTKADVAKCHACHAKCRGVTGDQSSPSAPPEPAQCPECHACHAKCHGVTGDQSSPSAPPEPVQCPKCHACHTKRRWISPSATPATQNEGGCHQVPGLPRKTKVDVTKCHACHVKRR